MYMHINPKPPLFYFVVLFLPLYSQHTGKNQPDGGGRSLESSQDLASFYVSFLHVLQIPAAIAIAANSRVCREEA